MGYLVPGTKKQENYALNQELGDTFNDGQEEAKALMSDLFALYHMPKEKFEENRNQYGAKLMVAFLTFGIDPREIESMQLSDGARPAILNIDEIRERFQNTFHKLWKSVSVAQELKDKNLSVADIYKNYSEIYDRILLEKDMFQGLVDAGKFTENSGPEKLWPILRDLTLSVMGRNADERFSEEELKKIKEQTGILNTSFKPNAEAGVQAGPGVFSGDSIQTVQDLKDYIAGYETMLRDYFNDVAEKDDFNEFASHYQGKKSKDEIKNLTEDDLLTVNEKIGQEPWDQFENKLREMYADSMKAFQSLANEKDVYSAYKDAQTEVENVILEEGRALDENSVIPELNAELKREDWKIHESVADFEKHIGKLASKRGEDQTNLNERKELKEIYNDYEKKSYFWVRKPEFNIEWNRVQKIDEFKNTYGSKFRNAVKESSGKIPTYQKEIQRQLNELNKKMKDLRENSQMASTKVQKELLKETEAFTNHLNQTIGQIQADYKTAIDEWKKESKAYTDNLRKDLQKETQQYVDDLKQEVQNQKQFRTDLNQAYQNSAYGKRMKENGIEVEFVHPADQLDEICDALDGVVKKNMFGHVKENSKEYNNMVAAVREFTAGKKTAHEAHEACEKYLAPNLNDKGGIDHMVSEVGKIRKQACVRMMELLESSYSYRNKEYTNKRTRSSNAQKGSEKEKINYKKLKRSLASSASKDAVKDMKKGEKKSYADLNKRIKEAKKERDLEK